MMLFSSPLVWDNLKVDDVGAGAVLGDASAVFGDCEAKFDVIGEGQLADVLQERDGTGVAEKPQATFRSPGAM